MFPTQVVASSAVIVKGPYTGLIMDKNENQLLPINGTNQAATTGYKKKSGCIEVYEKMSLLLT